MSLGISGRAAQRRHSSVVPGLAALGRWTQSARRAWRPLAVLLAVVLSAGWITGSGAPDRLRERDLALAGSTAVMGQVGVATWTRVYGAAASTPGDAPNGAVINGPLGDPTSVLTKINDRLDPMQVRSGLYPLRKAFEQLSIWILVPLLFLSLAKAVAMGMNRGDAQLAEVAKQLAVVVVLMWSYPLWDIVIFRFVAIPVAGALSNKTTLAAVANAASRRGTYTAINVGTPLSNISVQAQRGTACSVTPKVPECSTAISQAARDAMLEEARSNKVSGGDDVSGTRDWLSITPTGIMTSLVSFVLAGVMWFIWLGVIVGRAFSLCLAPMALAWGMLNKEKAYQWFKGHAGICFMPVGFSFATLVVWALNVAVFNSPSGDLFGVGAIVGLGLKTALCVVMMMALFKSGALSKMISGDVAAAAATIGTAVRDRTVQFATTGVKTASVGAGAVASGQAAQGLSAAGDRIRAAGADRGKFGTLAMMGRGSLEALRGTAQAANWVRKNRTNTSQYAGANAAKPKVAWELTGGAAIGAYKAAATKAQQEQANRIAAPSDSGAELLGRLAEQDVARRTLKAQANLAPRLRAGEQLPVSAEEAETTFTGRDVSPAQYAAGLVGMKLATQYLTVTGGERTLTYQVIERDGVRQTDVGEETLSGLNRTLDTDPKLRAEVMKMLEQDIGKDRVPTILGNTGRLPDLRQAVRMSPSLVQALTTAASVVNEQQSELVRREMLSAALIDASVQPNSLLELVVREMDPALIAPDASGDELRDTGAQMLRRAWYAGATPAERRAAGLPEIGGEEAAARRRNLTGLPSWVTEAEALGPDAVAPTITAAVRQAMTDHAARFEALRERTTMGETLGFKADEFRRTGQEAYEAEPGSLYAQAAERLGQDATPGEIYEAARADADALIASGRDGVNPDYLRGTPPEGLREAKVQALLFQETAHAYDAAVEGAEAAAAAGRRAQQTQAGA